MNGLKFKIGDKVRVVRHCNHNGCSICPQMMGTEYTITKFRVLEALGIMASFEETTLYEAMIEQLDPVKDTTPLPLPG